MATTTMCSSMHPHNERQQLLLKRYSDIIQKSQKALQQREASIASLYSTTTESSKTLKTDDAENCKKINVTGRKRARQEVTLVECEKKEFERRKVEIQKGSEAARKKIVAMHNDSGITQCSKKQKTDDAENKKNVADMMRVRREEFVERKKNELVRKAEIQREREAARKKIEAMHNDSGICDPQQVMRDFEELIGYNKNGVSNHASQWAHGSMSYSLMETDFYTVNVEEPEEGEILD